MSRWDPDARGRLQVAAFELFAERGYEDVTVAEIAERAGLKKRSFFRHYADKREVLFSGADAFQLAIVEDVRHGAQSGRPIEAVTAALATAGARLVAWGEPTRQRQQLIESSSELRERELIKLDSLATAIAVALREAGVGTVGAELAAQAGIAAFTTAFRRWIESPAQHDFAALMQDALDRLAVMLRDRDAG